MLIIELKNTKIQKSNKNATFGSIEQKKQNENNK
jgi:hypothetical protein